MGGNGRTFWWAKDAAWYDREANVILGSEFGAEGTTVLDVLSCHAKLENDAGRVKTGYASLTRKGNISNEDRTRAIIARAVELGALDDFSEDRLTFSARVSGWKADQDLARAAVRQGQHRATAAVRDTPLLGVTQRNEPSPTTQDNRGEHREQQNDPAEPDRLDVAKQRLQSSTVSELFAYWRQQCGHPHAKLTDDRRRRVVARLREGYSAEQIREGIDGAAKAAHVNDAGQRFDDLELICRSGSKLESFIGRRAGTAASTPSSEKQERSARRMAAFNRVSGGAA